MAAKDAGLGDKNRNPGTASGAGSDDDAIIQRLIDGPSFGEIDRTSSNAGSENGGSSKDGGDGGNESGIGTGNRDGSGDNGGGSGSESGSGAGTGTATKRTGNRSRSSGRNASDGAASKEARTTGDDVSRKQLKTPKQPKIDAESIELPGTNKEIIGDVFQFFFWGIGQATGIPEWELEDDDAETIGENGEKWLKSLGPKRAKNVVNGLKKIGPSVAFFGSLGMALVPRVKLTIDRAKNGAIKPVKERKSGAGNPVDPASPSDSPTGGSSNSDISAGFHARPFTAKDFGEATAGFVGEATGG